MSNTIFLVKKVKYIHKGLMPFLFFALTSQDRELARQFHLGSFSMSLMYVWAKGVSLWVWDAWLCFSSSHRGLLKVQAASQGLTGKITTVDMCLYLTTLLTCMSLCHRKALSEFICMCDLTSIPGCALTQTLQEDPAPFAWVPNTIFLSLHICIFICLLLALLTCTQTHLLSLGIHGGMMIAIVFTGEFPAKAFMDKPVNKYFPASVSLNKCPHECSFASKFLDKSSSVHISASTCFGICLPIRI